MNVEASRALKFLIELTCFTWSPVHCTGLHDAYKTTHYNVSIKRRDVVQRKIRITIIIKYHASVLWGYRMRIFYQKVYLKTVRSRIVVENSQISMQRNESEYNLSSPSCPKDHFNLKFVTTSKVVLAKRHWKPIGINYYTKIYFQ